MSKDRQFGFVLSDEELAALHQVAAAAGQSASDWLRTAIAKAHKAGKFEPVGRSAKKNHSWGPRAR